MLLTIIVVIAIIGYIVSWIINPSKARCHSTRQLQGKTVIVTGANSGIGLETAKDLARRKAKVILACRNMDKANIAKDDIVRSTGNTNVTVKKVDLSSLKSVRKFCKDVVETEERLDILVNNAAVALVQKKTITEDNLESQMAANYFGPFLLTILLIGLLKKTPGSRVVNVSSRAHEHAKFDLENLNSEKTFSTVTIYCNSKLANILFNDELSRRLEGTGITCNSLHPGTANTNLGQNIPKLLLVFLKLIANFMAITSEQGAQTSIYLCVSEDVENVTGKYFYGCKVARRSAVAEDTALGRKLWEISEKLVGLTPEEAKF